MNSPSRALNTRFAYRPVPRAALLGVIAPPFILFAVELDGGSALTNRPAVALAAVVSLYVLRQQRIGVELTDSPGVLRVQNTWRTYEISAADVRSLRLTHLGLVIERRAGTTTRAWALASTSLLPRRRSDPPPALVAKQLAGLLQVPLEQPAGVSLSREERRRRRR